MLRFHGVMFAAGIVAAMLSGGAALADARIFTVRASEPGVTIEHAFRNGTELAVVGRGDGSTLFRIDEPSTIVACANRFDFVASTGEKVNLAADMCVLNWEVTVQVAAGAAPPATTVDTDESPPPDVPATLVPPATSVEAPVLPAIPPAPVLPEVPDDTQTPPAATAPPPGAFSQVVTVTADDPAVTITGLALDGVPVAITGRGQGNVTFEIKGSEQGIVCQRDLGLTLSDGRQVTQPVNLCLNDWQVKVVVAGAAPGGTLPVPPPPPAAPGTGVTALPAPGVAEGMVWSFAAGEIAGTLVFGVPETDATALVATCNRGSDRITVTLYDAAVPGLQPGAPVPVNFFAGGFTKAYQGKMTAVSEESGVAHPEVVISARDPLWSALIKETNLGISAGPAYSATLSLKGSAAPARQLLATCLNTPAPPPASPPPVVAVPGGGGGGGGGGGIVARYACEIGPGFRVTYFGNKGIAVLDEPGVPPLTLSYMPEGSLGRYVAGEARLVLREDHVRWSRFGERPRTCFPR